jgi:CRP/FNR family cyclic AMP-dependent transcriptional regulator
VQWPLLGVLSDSDRRELLQRARRRRFARQEIVFHEGDPGDALHLVEKGHVAIRIHTPLGDVATVRIVRPGEFFGELAVIAPGPRNATAVALDPTDTLVVDRAQLTELREQHAHVDTMLIEALASEVRRLAQQLVDAMYVPVDKRVWRRLRELTIVFGTDDVPELEIPITQDVLAQLAGCTRPTANRTLRAGEEAGIIRMARGRLEILDLPAVEKRAR